MSLKRAAFSAGRWTAASAIAVTVLQTAQMAALARIVAPMDFGLMAVTGAVITFLSLLVDMGLSRALIHFDDVPRDHLSSLYWLNFLLAIAFMVLVFFAAPLLAMLYKSPSLAPVLQAASLIFPLTAVGQQLRTLAEKELQFSVLARIEVAAVFLAGVAAVSVAMGGGGVYALVIGLLAKAGLSSVFAWRWLQCVHRPTWHLRIGETRSYVRLGAYLVGDSLANNFNRESDVFVGGLALGPAAVGIYSVPRDLNLRLASTINPIITRVGFPVMSRVKGDREQLKSIFVQTLRLTAAVNFPIYIALALFANEVVALLYGQKWHDAAYFLRVLAAWGLIRSIGNPLGTLLYAVGAARRAFLWNIFLLFVIPVTYWMIAHTYGLVGLALGMVMLQLVLFFPGWRLLAYPCCDIGLREYLAPIVTPLWIALAAGVMAWVSTRGVPHGTLRLAIGGTIGAGCYLALSYLFNRSWVMAMLELLNLNGASRV